MVSFRFCMGRSLCYVLLNFLIKFVKQRAREELAEGHIEPITKLFTGVRALIYLPSHRPPLRLRMFSPRRAISVSSCCLDPHLTPYFLNLRLQLELLYRTGYNTKTIRLSRCFFRVKCDTFMMFSIESQI